jgi:transcriptional antiterminator
MKKNGNECKVFEKSPFMTSSELAEYLKVSKITIQKNYFRIAGSCKVGRTRRYDLRKIEENLRLYGTIFKPMEKRS